MPRRYQSHRRECAQSPSGPHLMTNRRFQILPSLDFLKTPLERQPTSTILPIIPATHYQPPATSNACIISSISAQFVTFAAVTDRTDERDPAISTLVSDYGSRLAHILDLLASICVQKGKGEVYAVMMRLHDNNDGGGGGKFTLTTAGNSGVPPQVVSHLQSVLSQVQTISDSCHNSHNDRRTTYPLKYDEISPFQALILDLEQLVVDLKASIYPHSIEKFVSRIKKRYFGVMDFIRRLDQCATKEMGLANKTWKSLLAVSSLIALITEDVLPTDFVYEDLVTIMDCLNKEVCVILLLRVLTVFVHDVKRKYAL